MPKSKIIRPNIFRDPNRLGDWVEIQFAADAAAQGFYVLRPLGHWSRYDFVLEYCGSFLRIQVKATRKQTWAIFGVDCRSHGPRREGRHCGRRPYHPSEVDFVAAYIAEARVWYLIPIHEVLALKSILRFDPYNEGRVRHLEQFREGWRLLRRTALRRRPRYVRPSSHSLLSAAAGSKSQRA